MSRIKGQSQEEREATETRSKKIQERDFHFILESRVSELKRKAAESLVDQLKAEQNNRYYSHAQVYVWHRGL